MDDKEKIMERIRRLEQWTHPPIDWDKRIESLALKVKKLSKLISKRRK